MRLPRFRLFRRPPSARPRFGAEELDGVGSSIRTAFPIPLDAAGERMRELLAHSFYLDEGDERMRDLIAKLREIEARPDAPAAEPKLI